MTKVAVPSIENGGLNVPMNQRFGRCPCFTLVIIEGKEINEVKVIPNPAMNATGGAGIQAAQTLGNNNVNSVIVGFLGPNASNALNALKIDVFQAPNQVITVKRALELYIKEELPKITQANAGSHAGMGRGAGRGFGGGSRRPAGGSRGRRGQFD